MTKAEFVAVCSMFLVTSETVDHEVDQELAAHYQQVEHHSESRVDKANAQGRGGGFDEVWGCGVHWSFSWMR